MDLAFFWLFVGIFVFVSDIVADQSHEDMASDMPSHIVCDDSENDDFTGCKISTYDNNEYTICEFSNRFEIDNGSNEESSTHISLNLRDDNNVVLATFKNLKNYLGRINPTRELVFAMNADMYDKHRLPIGLYVENGEILKQINQRDGPGNFHLKPNGVFYLSRIGEESDSLVAHVADTKSFLKTDITPFYATQSGPMLVIKGTLHPRFLKHSTSRKRRNGVGVSGDGMRLYFVISNEAVTFYEFGSFFKDHLQTENALFLDGTISKIFSTHIGRHDRGSAMGPMIAVTRKRPNP